MNGLAFRTARAEDEPFLLRVYASTREEEVAPLPWSAAEKRGFLAQQAAAQHQHYRTHYKDAEYRVILLDGEAIGRLYLARMPGEIRIMDIALLPAYRNLGIGARLITDIIEEAAAAGQRVSVHVEAFNPARRLYERLGFCEAEDKGVYLLLRWEPEVSHA